MILNVQLIIDRLKTVMTAGHLQAVGGIGSVAEAPEKTIVGESAFAMPPAVQGGSHKVATGATVQNLSVSFGIALVFLGVGSQEPTLTTTIRDDTQAVFDAFFGWTPDATVFSPAVLQQAGVEDCDPEKGFLIYSLTFATNVHVRT